MASQVEVIKWVPGTDFLVDGFAFKTPRCSHYFLTHFHSDHTVGLSKSFDRGVIYCSHITARLLVHDMGLKPQFVRPLAVGTAAIIQGVRVTTLDANHCPGAVMFLFEVPAAAAAATKARPPAAAPATAPSDSVPSTPAPHPAAGASPAGPGAASQLAGPSGLEAEAGLLTPEGGAAGGQAALRRAPASADSPDKPGVSDFGAAAAGTHNILHTGDCRWQRWMRDQPGLAGVRVDTLLLDTTYAAPKHTHPPQEEAIALMAQVMRDALAAEPQTVFVVGAYHIGKERAFLGAAQQLGARVWCSPAKCAVLRLLELPAELMALLVDDPRDAAVHVTGWGLRPEDLQAYLERHPGVWKQAVGIRPTGWTLRRSGGVSQWWREGNVSVVGVPYSEHSSWTDLCDAVSQLRPRTLIPTVNAATAAQRRALVDRFAHLMDLSADRSRLDVYLFRGVLAGRADSQAGCEEGAMGAPASGVCAARDGSGAATAACVATPLTAVLVDLDAIDLAEQERILADLQQQQQPKAAQQRQRQQQQQQQQQQRRGKRKSQGSEDAAVGTTTNKRPRANAQQQQQQPDAQDGAASADTARGRPIKAAPGSACRQRQAGSDIASADAAGGNAGRRPACSSGMFSNGGGGSSAACVIDLSGDDAAAGDHGYKNDIMQIEAPARSRASSGEGLPGADYGTNPQRPAWECQAAGKVRREAGRLGSGGGASPGRQPTQPAAAAAQVPSAWQSSIRRFFAPISRVAAVMLGGREGGVCVQEF